MLQGNTHRETMVYCLTMGGSFPAKSPWPEYHHSAYPAVYQAQQEWLSLKAAYSNSLWFPNCQDLFPDLWDTINNKFPLAEALIEAAKRKETDTTIIQLMEQELQNAENAQKICNLESAKIHLDWIIQAAPEPHTLAPILLIPIYWALKRTRFWYN